MVEKYKCSICTGVFPAEAFGKLTQKYSKRAGLQYVCKVCISLGSSQRCSRRNQSLKEKLVALKGGKCEHCRGAFPTYLFDFHHVNPEEKEVGLGRASRVEALRELPKCILLCKHCHCTEHHRLQRIKDAENLEKLRRRIAYYSALSNPG